MQFGLGGNGLEKGYAFHRRQAGVCIGLDLFLFVHIQQSEGNSFAPDFFLHNMHSYTLCNHIWGF